MKCFQANRFYQHSGGRKIYICGEINTVAFGRCFIAEESGGSFSPAEMNEDATQGWFEISEEEFIKNEQSKKVGVSEVSLKQINQAVDTYRNIGIISSQLNPYFQERCDRFYEDSIAFFRDANIDVDQVGGDMYMIAAVVKYYIENCEEAKRSYELHNQKEVQ